MSKLSRHDRTVPERVQHMIEPSRTEHQVLADHRTTEFDARWRLSACVPMNLCARYSALYGQKLQKVNQILVATIPLDLCIQKLNPTIAVDWLNRSVAKEQPQSGLSEFPNDYGDVVALFRYG